MRRLPAFGLGLEPRAMANVAVVSVHYYEHYVQPGCVAARRLAARAKAEQMVFVANRPGLVEAIRRFAGAGSEGRASVLEHDNAGAEFGAYQAGLHSLLPNLPTWVIFLNDTFSLHQSFSSVYRRKLLSCVASLGASPPRAAGQIESLPAEYSILGSRTNRWLTTNIFALNRAAIDALDGKLFHPELDAFVRASAKPGEFFSSQVDPVLAEHLSAWLFGRPSEKAWYGAEPLDDSNARRFAFKARAILQEKYLAALLLEAGTVLIDVRRSNRVERLISRVEAKLHARRHPRLAPT